MSGRDGHRFLLFESDHQVFRAENAARERDLPARVVPAPAGAEDRCGLALRISPDRLGDLEALCDGEGISYTLLD